MAIRSASVSVGTTATLLTASETDYQGGQTVALSNGGAATVYLGGSTVTTGTGYPLAAGAQISLDLAHDNEQLYGIVASGTVAVAVLETGV